jgi:hypothetical protein
MHTSDGTILVYTDKVILAVDPGLAELYRSLIPKHFAVKRGRYDPHITVAREELISDKWKSWSGTRVRFWYDTNIRNDGSVYWWLNVQSIALNILRVHCDLPLYSEKSRPPDGSDNFHITIGNTKS